MLPPQLHQAVRQRSLSMSAIAVRTSASAVVRTSAACTQARSFWGWRRPRDYDSHTDPMFHRFQRYRTLKTRAKLLDKLRRRGRWDWDGTQRAFFSPRDVRFASHIGRPRWKNNDDGQAAKNEPATEEDGFELSQREKEWKDQMEAMRKRIEQDPYEAVFGKRFEPFWSPLVPSWMREEMGLDRWPKPKETVKQNKVPETPISKQAKNPPEPVRPVEPAQPQQRKDIDSESETPNGQLTSYSYAPKKTIPDADPECPNGQLTNYSYSSNTSWDSWTKKTRREEWDSISGQTRRYEYDPITNRMIQIEAREPAKPIQKAISSQKKPLVVKSPTEAVNVAVKKSNEARKPIPVPTRTTELSTTKPKTSVYFPSLLNTSVASNAPKPSAIATFREMGLELLTADEVRASVGKAKQEPGAVAQDQVDESRAHRNGKADLSKSGWDQAETHIILDRELSSLNSKKEKLIRQEQGLFHIETQKHEIAKLIDRIGEVRKELLRVSSMQSRTEMQPSLDRLARLDTKPATLPRPVSGMQPALERMVKKDQPVPVELDDSAAHESTGDPIDYKSMNVPKDWEKQAELLQADRVRRTRGSTEAKEAPSQPHKMTEEQKAEVFRLRREGLSWKDIAAKIKEKPAAPPKQRWIDFMISRKAVLDAQKAEEKAAVDARDAEKNAKLERTNAMLESEVQEQKFRMQAHENRYAHKIRALRQELDTAYKQSSISTEMQMERIKNLEHKLEKAQKAAGDDSKMAKFQSERERFQQKITDLRKELDTTFKQSSANAEMQVDRIKHLEQKLEEVQANNSTESQRERSRYKEKVRALRDELKTSFKQSAVNAEKHVERIRELEQELEKARSIVGNQQTENVRAEGDICSNVAKYAKDSMKWYKQPHSIPEATDKAVQLQRDRALVREVQAIYEGRYGTIDVNHRQSEPFAQRDVKKQEPQVVEVESDVDLGKALADYEKEQTYQYQPDNLEAEIAAQEKEAHEAQALMAPESSGKMRQIIADGLELDQDVHGTRIINDQAPKLIPTETSARNDNAPAELEIDNVRWEEPPLYKVLAYDSGNDMFSTATTSSNFTGKETPISIPEALSQLYQPARFVPHFAELQREGYQVIHGTKDLLVFKKVKTTTIAEPETAETSLHDHGLFGAVGEHSAGVNPIDGTSYSTAEPSTGRFASPTGFVGDNWDALVSSEGKAQAPSTITPNSASACATSSELKSPHANYSQPADEEPSEVEIKHYPRVKREERVFSGGRLQHKRFANRRHHSGPTPEQIKKLHKRWTDYKRRFRWAIGVGLGASGVAYLVGSAAEKKEKRDKERWEQILEGTRARWE